MKYLGRLSKYCAALCLCLAGSFCFSLPASASSITDSCSQQQYIRIQLEQWNNLKKETNLLEAKLSIVSDILATQKGTSMELVQQLAEARLQLQETQKALTSSKTSLKNAEKALDDSKALYETLMNSIEHDRKVYNRTKNQRNLAVSIAGSLLLYIAVK